MGATPRGARRAAAPGRGAGRSRAATDRRAPATRSPTCSRSGSGCAASAAWSRRKRRRAAEEAEARDLPRRDLTALATFTVDPATARDFDDAVSAQREGDGWRVWVHIADVAAHVRPGSPLDMEALRRANSTYVPGTVEPMLPHSLSSGACTLSPGVERLAVTAEIELDADGAAEPHHLLPQPDPLRRAARLRPARPRLRRPRGAARRTLAEPLRRGARRRRARSARVAAPPRSTSNRPSRSSSSTPRATSSPPTGCRRPRPTG